MRPPFIWLITDTHWNSDFEGRRPSDYAIKLSTNCRKVIAKQDILIHLGDVINDRPSELKQWLSINGDCITKILVRGNHDKEKDSWYLNKGFNLVVDQLVIKDVLLSHIPAPLPPGVRINIHGHFHNNPLERCLERDPQIVPYYKPETHKLLALEFVDYKPVRLDEFSKL